MRKLILILFIVVFAPAAGIAQRPEVYAFIAPGAVYDEATLHYGFGGGGPIYKGLGFGLELGYLAPMRYQKEGFGVFSADGAYYFRRESTSSKLVPFATGGYSVGFRYGAAQGFNFGGGLSYWFANRAGLRFEVRDHVLQRSHFYGFRVGLAFRGSGEN